MIIWRFFGIFFAFLETRKGGCERQKGGKKKLYFYDFGKGD
jgi:hypothetical protein